MNINKNLSDNTKITMALLEASGVGKKTVYNVYASLLSSNEIDVEDDDDLKMLVGGTISNSRNKSRVKLDTEIFKEIYYNKVEKIINEADEKSIKIMGMGDSDYPLRLSNIKNDKFLLPLILYCKGNLSSFDENRNVAIIGTRKPNSHGLEVTKFFSERFTNMGWSIISGLAIGCDTQAHQSCVDLNGKTMAILPSAVDKVYPKSNKKLAEDILDNDGVLISEYFNISRTTKNMFIERDRLQSAFSDIILVASATLKTGTKYAVENGILLDKLVSSYKPNEKYKSDLTFKGNLNFIDKCNAFPVDKDKDSISHIIKKFEDRIDLNNLKSSKQTKLI